MTREMVLAILFSALPAIPAVAQGRGQGGGGGAQRGGAEGAPPGQRGQAPDAGQRGGQSPAGQQSTRDQQRERIRATAQQRAQLESCTQSANRVSERAREMAEAAKGGGRNNAEFRRLHDQLREEVRTMQQERDRFENGLSQEQRAVLQDRIRKLDQARDRLNERIRLLDGEMAKPEPDRKRLRDYATGVEKAMREWQKRVREMGSDMGAQS